MQALSACYVNLESPVLLFTFPQPSDALVPGDGLVGIKRVAVSAHGAAAGQPHLSLEPDFHHIGGLRDGHRHRSRGAARQQPSPDSCIFDTSKDARFASDATNKFTAV